MKFIFETNYFFKLKLNFNGHFYVREDWGDRRGD
jgi:hypothetical protein